KCMDDGSFALGGVFSAQLSVKLRLQRTNSFNIIGSKINVFSWFGNEENTIDNESVRFRGVFWVTSATRINDIYTIAASDAIIWLDSVNYGDNYETSNVIYNRFCSWRYSLSGCMQVVVDEANKVSGATAGLTYIDDSGIINNTPPNEAYYCLLTPEHVGEISTRNPRDYASWIAELACGFVYTHYNQNGDHEPYIKIGQFTDDNVIEINYDEVELNTLEIADFVLNFSRVHCKFYDGKLYNCFNSNGGITIDISENPFKDGWYFYLLQHDGHHGKCDCYSAVAAAMYFKILEISHYFRPFKLKYHGREYFKLGQKIRLPDGKFSVVTSIKWQFRGGTNLTCAGRDTRILSVAAKRSQAAKVKDMAYSKINREKSDILKQLENSKKDLQGQINSKNNEISNLDSRINQLENGDFQGHINELRERIEAIENGG
ncbi:MAG: hypothetical protein K2I80_10390, partial [Ruminococcus sp.]|nr:hypothetical protein [Ruminococcus sp.]